ncbi:MAG: MFS transporter [Myxococcales bacterium]|nr:MAG: MFS transporter [Myxococcales bacterium]
MIPTRAFYLLTVTRWFPVGMVVGQFVLLQTERGNSTSQALTALALSGLACFLFELPTSGFADAFGRRPVYIAAAVLNVVVAALYLTAQSFWQFALAGAAMGVFRALDSGPLEAWVVDEIHRDRPGVDVDRELSRSGTVMGISMALSALLGGALIWWHPVEEFSAITGAVFLYVVLNVVHLVAVLRFMHEPDLQRGDGLRRALATARETPKVIASGVRLMRADRVLLALILVEVFWSIGMISFESLLPIRLTEFLGDESRAGALMGPIAAGGWAIFAFGTAIAGWSSPRIGIARTAMLGRVLNSVGAIVMGLAAGPVALVAAYLFTYTFHGTNGPPHAALLHRQATRENRATVLSMNSMMAFLSFAVAAPLVGLLADRTSTALAIVVCGVTGLVGVLGYLPARRAEAQRKGLDDSVEVTSLPM